MRDITLNDTFRHHFTTRAFATGIPTVLANTPVLSVLEEDNATPITAGVSISVDRASVVGLNEATIIATTGNGYESGKSYSIYISTGTVGGVSVVGEVVGHFTIAASAAAVDLANGTDGLGAIKAETALIVADTNELQADDVPTLIAAVQSDTDDIQTRLPAALVSGRMDSSLDATGFEAEAVDLIWDEVLTGATHNVTNSSGKRLRQLEDASVITSGTAQAGGTATITLAAGESATNDIFAGDRVIIVGATGVGEHGIITTYDGGTKIATMSKNWVITPDATSEYDLVPADVDIETIEHSAVATDNLMSDYDGTGYDKANSTIGTCTTVTGSVGSVTGAVGSVTGAVGSVTGNVGGNVVGTVASVTGNVDGNVTGSVASVVADVGITQAGADKVFGSSGATLAELSQAIPAATPRPDQAFMLIYMALRNKLDVATVATDTLEIHNDAGTRIAQKLITDDGADYSEAKMISGV